MFFRVSFFPNRSNLVAAVGDDGNVYWWSESIGKFLKYKTDAFTNRHATRELNQFIPKRIASFKSKRVFTFEEMVTLMKTARKRFPEADRLPVLWSEGRVINVNATPCIFPEHSPRLRFTEQADSIRLQDWVRLYIKNVLNEFSIRKRETMLTLKDVSTQCENGQDTPAGNDAQTCSELEPMDLEYYNMKETEGLPCGSAEGSEVKEAQSNELALLNPSLQLQVNSDMVPEEIYLKLNGTVYSYINLNLMP